MEEITEEQRQRAERNRLAALAKRKAAMDLRGQGVMGFFKSRKISPEPQNLPSKFRIRLEICSPDSFSITPLPLAPFPYPGESQCLKMISSWISSADPSHYTQNHGGGKSSVYKLGEYSMVHKCLKTMDGVEMQEIPWRTLNVVQRFLDSFIADQWIPCMPEHLSDDDVDELLMKLPRVLFDALLPFQLDGVRFGLRRGGRCLIADEMGLGKTIQAITIACCFMDEGSILIVCPAILRFSWAEELERWLPILSPTDIHLVFGHRDNPSNLAKCPKVVVISYTMLRRLRKSILAQEWALLIVDESHHVRCSKRASEPDEIKAILDVARNVKRKVLLSGTPSVSRPYDIFHQIDILWPGLLGTDKYEFAKIYCEAKSVKGFQGKVYQDFSKGVRLEELNVLLKQTVMIRRLKEHLLVQLPPKRRQIIRLVLTRSDINMAIAAAKEGDGSSTEARLEDEHANNYNSIRNDDGILGISESSSDSDDNSSSKSSRQLSYHELGIAKLSGFQEWLSIHPIFAESESERYSDAELVSHKMIIFAHHLKVLDRVQNFMCEREIKFVRIDGKTLARDRQAAVQEFRSSPEVKIALIGITAGGVGVDFSSARDVVFLELPQSVSDLLQAEDRAHRRGQTNAVNIYIFCAKDTSDELRWSHLNKSLQRVSSVMNGKYDAVQGIAIGGVSDVRCEKVLNNSERSKEMHNEDPIAEASDGNPDMRTHETVSERSSQEKWIGGVSDVCAEEEHYKSERSEEMHNEDPIAEASDGDPDMRTHETVCESSSEEKPCEVYEHQTHTISAAFNNRQDSEDSDTDMVDNTVRRGGLTRCTSDTWSIRKHSEVCINKLTKTDKLVLEPNIGEERVVVPSEENSSWFVPADSLRFEVSEFTGRIHLYTCILGKDSTPRLLCENFHPEEIESLTHPVVNKSHSFVKESAAYKDVIMTFIKEWNSLRPIQRRKLFGKSLRCPLSLELCFLEESISHCRGGLLKGGSERRVTPLSEISPQLPENAVWKKVSLSNSYGKKEKQYIQGWNSMGEPLCKLCQMPCKGKFARTPEIIDHLFCQVSCMEGYRARTNQSFLRKELFEIEHGVCRICGLDCHKLVQCLRPLPVAGRREYITKVAPKIASDKTLFDILVKQASEGNAWHADHIVAVHEGGGECTLENMRTLCVACHKGVTAAQTKQRRLKRIDDKKRLKRMLCGVQNDSRSESPSSDPKDEEDLLVKVPGSDYTPSGKKSSTSENITTESRSPSAFTAIGSEQINSIIESITTESSSS